ncbi:RNA-directed DNA polymerase, eukaryota, reverse transcriptase zinc-binding domain protein [Tanacetum coccineum]
MDLNMAVWNIRGMCTSDKQKEVRSLMNEEKLQLCGIIETHVKYSKILKIGEKVFGNWDFISNGEDNNQGCRIMVGWNPNKLRVWLIARTKQCMFLLVETLCLKVKFFCTIVYASNSYIDRRKLWRDLGAQKSITNGDPWVIIGDFNVSLKVEEHSNGSFALSNEMNEFLDCTREIEVEDILSSGFHFTWTKSRGNPKCKTLKKLDRIMINKAFMEKFPSSHGIFLPYLISDYSLVVLKLPNGMEKRRKAFRFSNFVTDKKEFLPTVMKAWETEIDGHMMYKVVKKLKLMKHSLNNLSWENGNIFERVSKLKDCMKESQAEVDRYPHDDTIKAKSCKVLQEYYKALNEENSLLMQKAKIEWLKDGDRNTKFFHKIIKGRMHKGRIMSVCNEKRERFENEKVAEQFVKHFQEFLGKKDLVMEFPADRIVFPNKLSSDEVDRMSRSISEVEVKNSMFDIDDSKAPGPYGFIARFFKSTWSIIGKDVSKAIQEFFITGKLLGEVNATLISLVPKIQNPDKVSDYRPIACCNVLYKCISKIVTNKIKGVLGKLVNESQSAFIAGRNITDNIILAQELFKGYNSKQKFRRVAFKIDLQKAYDTIDWGFLKIVLEQFGFPGKMVEWIMTCVSTTKFSINVNGEREGYFSGGRGLRQGDPMSPYLFTLVMEVFSIIMGRNISKNKDFKYHHGCKNLQITHLCFADDLLVFCHGDIKSVSTIKESLEEFSNYSGLKANMNKSTIFFRGLTITEQSIILDIIPFAIGSLPVRYLGVPLITKKICATDCKPLIDKVKSRVMDWRNKALSYSGRLQLIVSVLSTMQIYWASVFLLPKNVIYEINKVLKGFLWCQGKLTKGKAKVSWGNICKPKEQGGLGIKDLELWNEVLLVKQLWNVILNKNTLWVKWVKFESLKGKSIWEINAQSNSSAGWKEMLKLRDKIRKHVLWKVGDGKSVNVWYDNWNTAGALSEIVSTRDMYDAGMSINSTVADLTIINEGKWHVGWEIEYPILKLYKIPSLQDGRNDEIVWVDNAGHERVFGVKYVWKDLCCDDSKVDWHKIVWFSKCIPRHAFVVWMAIQNRLNTQDRIALWKLNEKMQCVFCKKCLDSIDHLFFICELSKEVWREMQKTLNVSMPFSWENSVKELCRLPNTKNIWSIVRKLVFGAIVYFILQERNKRIFKGERRDVNSLVHVIKEVIRLKLAGMEVKESNTIKEVEERWSVKFQRRNRTVYS